MSPTGRVVGVAVALFVLASAACGGGTGSRSASGRQGRVRSRASTLQRVAVQLSDLEPGFKSCAYSGDMDTYLRNIKDLNADTYQSVMSTWTDLKRAGATAGYAAYFGDSDRACRNLIVPREQRDFGSEEEHVRNHPKMVSSFVIQFGDQAAAEAAYNADIFDHSQLADEPAFDVARGEATRLGRNSIVAASKGSPIPTRQAVWQRRSFDILFQSTAIDRQASETVTAAMNARIR